MKLIKVSEDKYITVSNEAFIKDDSGMFIYFPGPNGGGYNEYHILEILRHLNGLNYVWKETLEDSGF